MIIQKLMGGLGNQMFQYAFIRSLSLRNNLEFSYFFENPQGIFTKRHYELSIFQIKGKLLKKSEYYNYLYGDKLLTKIAKIILNKPLINPYFVIKENQFSYNSVYSKATDNKIYIGYWQSEKYFLDYKKIIRKEFQFNQKLGLKNRKIYQLLKKNICISIHVRRGDYVKDKNTNNFHGVCIKRYYDKAIKYLTLKIKNTQFIVFSDDPKWCKKNLLVPGKPIFVDWNIGKKSYNDMYLMSLCKHNIIANSSFSWWGAWLNSNPNKIVIAPKKWFTNSKINTIDLIPKNWIRI